MSKSWQVDVQQNEDGEYFIQFTDEMLEGTNLKAGDDIVWIDNKDGSWTLQKSDKVWVLVEAVSQHRMRYMVQVPATNPEWALDTVTMSEAQEFSQEWLGETIVSHRVISTEDALELCNVDNEYSSTLSAEDKIKIYFTTWEQQQPKEPVHSEHYYDTERNK